MDDFGTDSTLHGAEQELARQLAETAARRPSVSADVVLARVHDAMAEVSCQTRVGAKKDRSRKWSNLKSGRWLLGRWTLRRWGYAGVAGVLVAMVLVGAHVRQPPRHEVPRRYVTRAGQRLGLTLPNGTHVVLAPRTTLQLTSTAGTLVGEAFFEVPHHMRTPFAIHTGSVTTRVLGTAFDVTRYPDQRETQVVVITGRVATGATSMTTLSARTIARVTDSTITVKHVEDLTPLTSWTKGSLTFDDAPVSVVLASLGRWYGLTFRLVDSTLAKRHLTTTLDIRDDQSQVFEVLESTLAVRATTVGDTVVLVPRRSLPRIVPGRHDTPSSFTFPQEIGR